ncbi:MAG: hypothetical protein R8L53_06555 [Mariprofundales bacterium]
MTLLKSLFKKNIYLIALLVGLLLFIELGQLVVLYPIAKIIAYPCSKVQNVTVTAIKAERSKVCESGDNPKLSMEKVTTFNWDKLHIYLPYTPKSNIATSIGYEWNVLACTKSDIYDEWTQFVFTKNNEVINFFDASSHYFNWNKLTNKQLEEGLSNSEALLSVNCN